MANHFSIVALRTPWTVCEGKKDRTLKDELPRSVSAQYASGEEWRNNSRKNEGLSQSKNNAQCGCDWWWKWRLMTSVCIEMLHRNLECQVHKSRQIRSGQTGDGKSEHWHFRNQWTKIDQKGTFNSDDHYIYYCGKESLRRSGVATMVNKRVWNAVLECNLKNNRMISVHFQSKPFNIMVIQVYALTSNAEEAEVERF